MAALDLLILALATLYAAYALTKTHGAFGMFEWTRKHLPLGGLTSCIVCAAFWIGLAFFLLWWAGAGVVVQVFAVAGAAMALAQYTGMSQQ